jgi:hypothetical protein
MHCQSPTKSSLEIIEFHLSSIATAILVVVQLSNKNEKYNNTIILFLIICPPLFHSILELL